MKIKLSVFALVTAAIVLAAAGHLNRTMAEETFGSVQDVCYWFKQKAMSTGDPAWWRRYYDCQRGRW